MAAKSETTTQSKSTHRDPKSAIEFSRFQGAGQRFRSSHLLFFGKIVKSSALDSRHTRALAHQRKHVISHPAQHTFCLLPGGGPFH
jgi:hypothetical protein